MHLTVTKHHEVQRENCAIVRHEPHSSNTEFTLSSHSVFGWVTRGTETEASEIFSFDISRADPFLVH